MNRQGIRKILKIFIFGLFLFVIVGYAIFASHDFILGPTISISEPKNGDIFYEPSVTIKGVAKRIRVITLNDREFTIDEEGNFKETVLLSPGYNIFKLFLEDKFGRSREYRLELIYKVN
ncbi:MAG TPA: hypothetical protein VJC02_00825 [Candidatus Paceibacterota bacterium]